MKRDLDSHTSSRSLTHPARNLNNKPAARNDHTAQPETEPALNRFALKPLALGVAVPAQILALYLLLWVACFGVAFFVGDRTGRRYDALCLTGILGFLGFLIFLLVVVLDGAQDEAGAQESAVR